jgi:hypothetical protein
MRAAAVAFVLIIAAAVVLWFGNTLNSWVLGGLIGGLAAILLSIPIALVLFSYLSNRQNEQFKTQEQEEAARAESYEYAEEYVGEEEVYDADAYVLSSEQAEYEEIEWRRMQMIQEPPASSSYPQLPAAGQSQASASARALAQQRSVMYPPASRQSSQSQALPSMRGKGAPAQRASDNGRVHYPGFPGYQVNSMRARQQTAALRAAQREAAQQYNDVEVLPRSTSQLKKLPPRRPSQPLAEQPARPAIPRTSRQLPQQQTTNQYPRRRVVDTTLAQRASMGNRLPGGGESYANRSSSTDALRLRQHEPQTDQLGRNNPQTGQMRYQFQTPQTGQIGRNSNPQQQTEPMARNPQLSEQRRNPDVITGSLKNPLLRRAPYMYEDDPLRQEFAQQIDPPAVRRSSRLLEEEH